MSLISDILILSYFSIKDLRFEEYFKENDTKKFFEIDIYLVKIYLILFSVIFYLNSTNKFFSNQNSPKYLKFSANSLKLLRENYFKDKLYLNGFVHCEDIYILKINEKLKE